MAFDSCKPVHYALHLKSLLSDQHITTRYSARTDTGQLLVEGGEALNAQMLSTIAEQTLVKPLEQLVHIEPGLSAGAMYEALQAVWSGAPDFEAGWTFMAQTLPLRGWCEEALALPVVHQHLSVLERVMPGMFRRALWCAPLVGYLAEKMNPAQALWWFVAALMQDTGWLHIVQNEPADQDQPDVRSRLHPLVGATVLAQYNNLPRLVSRAVSEHHERPEGTGYPRGLTHARMSESGAALSVVNSLWRLRLGGQLSRSLPGLLPVLRMRAAGPFKCWYDQISDWLLQAMPAHLFAPNAPEQLWPILRPMQRRLALLSGIYGLIAPLEALLARLPLAQAAGPARDRLDVVIVHLHQAVAASGILSDAILRWIEHVETMHLTEALPEMYEIEGVQAELRDQMQGVLVCVNALECALPVSTERRKLASLASAMSTLLGRYDAEAG